MNESCTPPSVITPDVSLARERTKQASIAGYTGGSTAFFAVCALVMNPTWPVAFAVTAVAAMVAFLCYCILKR